VDTPAEAFLLWEKHQLLKDIYCTTRRHREIFLTEPGSYAAMLAGIVALVFLFNRRERFLTKLLHQPNNSACRNA